jgi:hypothetical protein
VTWLFKTALLRIALKQVESDYQDRAVPAYGQLVSIHLRRRRSTFLFPVNWLMIWNGGHFDPGR